MSFYQNPSEAFSNQGGPPMGIGTEPYMSYPSRLINQRIQAINDEIVKQRQYLPQFRNHQYYQHIARGRNSQKVLESRSQIAGHGLKPTDMLSGANMDNTMHINSGGLLVDKNYAAASRHHAQSMVSPLNLSQEVPVFQKTDATSDFQISQVAMGLPQQQLQPNQQLASMNHHIKFTANEQQFMQQNFLQEKQSAYYSQGYPKIRRKQKQQSFEEHGLMDAIENISAPASSLGLLRNMARYNRPTDMEQLDQEYRLRTQGLVHNNGNPFNQSRGILLHHKGSSPVIDHLRSTQKSSTYQTTTGGKKHKRQRHGDLQPIDKAVFDVNSETADEINQFGSDNFVRKNLLSQGGKDSRKMNINKVKIIENQQIYATPAPKRQLMAANNSDIIENPTPLNKSKPKSQMHSKKLSKAQHQLASITSHNTGFVVNYVNGVPVTELSPPQPSLKKSGKQKLPRIYKSKESLPSSNHHNYYSNAQPQVGYPTSATAKQHPDILVRASQQFTGPATIKRISGSSTVKLATSARKRVHCSSSEKYRADLKNHHEQQQQQVIPTDERDLTRLRTHDEIVNDLEKQFGFTYEENQEAMRKLKEEQESRKKYATRKDKDLIARNIEYIKTLTESNRNIKKKTSSANSRQPQKINKEYLMKGLQSKDRLKAKQLLEQHEQNKTSITSPGRSKLSIRKKISKKELKEAVEKEGAADQINILIPIGDGEPKIEKTERVEKRKGNDKGILMIHRHQSLSPKKNKKATFQDTRGDSKHSARDSLRSFSRSKNSPRTNDDVSPSRSRSPSRGDRSKRSKGPHPDYKGYGPMPQQKKKKHRPNNLYDFNSRFFHKKNQNPSIMQVDVNQLDVHHLKAGDLDDMSKLEVTYKILKDQLREHQQVLIKKKEEIAEQEEAKRQAELKGKSLKASVDLHRFAKHIRHFENYGSDRTVSPEIQRIVKNLMCQEHSFMYCPKCKTYEQDAVNPIDNIQKFMQFVKNEQDKLKAYRRKKSAQRKRNARKMARGGRSLPNDSASDITDLEEKEILAKYLDEKMTEAERVAKERKIVQDRLYGSQDNQNQKHICSTTHGRPVSAPKLRKVKMELREVEKPVSMMDESVSAHQFSLQEQSVQADSEQRMDMGQQTSTIDKRSQGHQYSRQDMVSQANQCSEIDYMSNNMNTSIYPPGCNREHIASQTMQRKINTPKKVSKNVQTVKPRDEYKDDWEISQVYRKALRAECEKRGHVFVDPVPEHERIDDDSSTQEERQKSMRKYEPSPANVRSSYVTEQQSNTSDAKTAREDFKDDGVYTTIGFLKSYREKGNIKQLTETEIQYIKRLLKQKNRDYWTERSSLIDLHRHCKYTIRKLTQQMACIDNLVVFKHLKEPTREHTLYLIYRAEILQAALADSQKIFKLLSQTIYDSPELQRIMDEKSFSMEDVLFLKKRDTMFKRILTQSNTFLETYKLFNNQFIFKKMQIRDYLTIMSDRTKKALNQIEELRAQNPEQAAKEDERMKERQIKEKEEYIQRRVQLGINELNRDIGNEIMIQETNHERPGASTAVGQKRPNHVKTQRDQMQLNINKYTEQDFVGRETIEIINMQAQNSDIEASPFNKTDRQKQNAKKMSPSDELQSHVEYGQDENNLTEIHRVKSGLAAHNKSVFSPINSKLQ